MTLLDVSEPPQAAVSFDPADVPGEWVVLQVVPRCESDVAERLNYQGIEAYLPKVVDWIKNGKGKRCRALVPLYAGYVFAACLNSEDRGLLAWHGSRLGRIQSTIAVADQDGLRRSLHNIHEAIEVGRKFGKSILIGCRCEIIGGALIGKTGLITKVSSNREFVTVEAMILGNLRSVQVEYDKVEPID